MEYIFRHVMTIKHFTHFLSWTTIRIDESQKFSKTWTDQFKWSNENCQTTIELEVRHNIITFQQVTKPAATFSNVISFDLNNLLLQILGSDFKKLATSGSLEI